MIPKLVIVGRRGWLVDDLYHAVQIDPRVAGKVRILSELGDHDLEWLYRHSRFVLFPSFCEGWGLPLAEALGHGKLCISSSTSSMPEVAQGLADLIDPLDSNAWYERIKHYLSNPAEVTRREAEVRARYQPPRWSETAACVLAHLFPAQLKAAMEGSE